MRVCVCMCVKDGNKGKERKDTHKLTFIKLRQKPSRKLLRQGREAGKVSVGY